MFLRQNQRKKNGVTYEYWTLVESVRTERGPRQRVVACIGKAPGLDEDEKVGWENLARLLDGEDAEQTQGELFTQERVVTPQWTAVEDIVELMERKYGVAERIWALDRGMVSKENLDYLRAKKALYIVGTPKARLKKFEQALQEKADWQAAAPGVEVKIVPHPDGKGQERYVICRSHARHEKEAAMLRGQQQRLRVKCAQIDAALRKRPSDRPDLIERKIGKWLGRNSAAEKIFHIEVLVENGRAVGLRVTEDEQKLQWAASAHGAYLLRTNCTETDPAKLWQWYIQLTEVEDAFRISKTDLGLRPIYHQREDRVQAHILVCFIALAMWRSLEMWLRAKNLGDTARQVVAQTATLHSMDVILPVRERGPLRLRLVAKPEPLLADLLASLQLRLPRRPRILQNVVEKIGSF